MQALEATVARAVLSSTTSSICSAAGFLLQHRAALQPLLAGDCPQQGLQAGQPPGSYALGWCEHSRQMSNSSGQAAALHACGGTGPASSQQDVVDDGGSAAAVRPHLSHRQWQVLQTISSKPDAVLSADLLAEGAQMLQIAAATACLALLDSQSQINSLQSVLRRVQRQCQQQAAEIAILEEHKVSIQVWAIDLQA